MNLTKEGQPIPVVNAESRSLLNPQNFVLRCGELRMIPSNRIALVAGGALFILLTNLSTGQPVVLANAAETPTPTPTRTVTATPTPTIPGPWLTVTAVANQLNREQDAKKAEVTQTAIAQQRENLKQPATSTPTPLPPDVIVIPRDAYNKTVEQAVTSAQKALPTSTPYIIYREVEGKPAGGAGGSREGGFPWGFLIGAGLFGIGGSLAIARREKIRDLVVAAGVPTWRVTTWFRTHGGDRVVQSAPVQFVWRQARRLYGI